MVTTARELAMTIEDGDMVIVDTSRPTSVATALSERTNLSDVDVYAYGLPYTDPAPLDRLADTEGVQVSVSMAGPGVRELVSNGDIVYVPQSIYTVASSLWARTRDRRVVALLEVPLADRASQPLGPTNVFGELLANVADVLIAETNDQMPTAGGRTIPLSAVDHSLAVDRPVPTVPAQPRSDDVEATARRVVAELPPDPTLQLGIGGVPGAIGDRLVGGTDVDIWSGLVGEAVRPLIDAQQTGSVTGCVALGTDQSFYSWLSETDVRLRPPSVIHNPRNLLEIEGFVAINSALQIDLSGQVNAESIGQNIFGGVGGQPEFMSAAAYDPTGTAMIALTSRTESGIAKIVPSLDGPVTTPRHFVDTVVTDQSAVHIGGRSFEDRLDLLVHAAHPGDREALRDTSHHSQ